MNKAKKAAISYKYSHLKILSKQLQLYYNKEGGSINRPLTVSTFEGFVKQTAEIVETMAGSARTFTANEIEPFVRKPNKSHPEKIFD